MRKLLYIFLAISIIFSACEKEEEEEETPTNNNGNNNLSIGAYHQGGVIFYLDGNGSSLICDILDVAPSLARVEWGCYGDSIDVDNSEIGSGFSNTVKIINGCDKNGIAAEICYNLTRDGYTDWYLPSKDELIEIFLNRNSINTTLIANGGEPLLLQTRYWSSTEGNSGANAQADAIAVSDFNDGNGPGGKGVRIIHIM